MAKVEAKKESLKIERETYKSKGVERYSYFIRGLLMEREMKVSILANDITGYEYLDLMFSNKDSLDLKVTPFEIKNDETGEVITGNTYMAFTIDENTGEEFECPVKPHNKTDKVILEKLLSRL